MTNRRKLHVGDVVRLRDGTKFGVVVHVMRHEPNLIVVRWPLDKQGFCFHRDDLVKAAAYGEARP
jgi:hypothetical protein